MIEEWTRFATTPQLGKGGCIASSEFTRHHRVRGTRGTLLREASRQLRSEWVASEYVRPIEYFCLRSLVKYSAMRGESATRAWSAKILGNVGLSFFIKTGKA